MNRLVIYLKNEPVYSEKPARCSIYFSAVSFLFQGLLFFLIILSMHNCEDSSKPDKSLAANEIQATRMAALLEDYLQATPQPDSSLPIAAFDTVALTYENVTPILQDNCLFCHKPNSNAPFSLIGYKNVKKRAEAIREVLSKKIMPPWMADNDYVKFFNAPSMSDLERALVISWIDQGCSNANQTEIPKDNFLSSIETTPDLVISLPTQHTITSNSDTYQCSVYDPHLEEDRYLAGIEFVSDNPEVLHHLTLYLDTSRIADGRGSCWDCLHDGIFNRLTPIQAWSRGMRPFVLNSQLAHRIPKGARFILQTHYSDENHKGRSESTTLKFHFTDKPQEEVKFHGLNKFDIFYPANQIVTETMSYEVEDSISLFFIVPHAHFLTKKIESFAVTPEQEVIPLLKISEWDYLWQGQYIYEKPIIIPAGSTIYCNIVVDNTAENPTQPNNPVRDVIYETGANDEMFVLVLLKKNYSQGDENIEVANFLY